MQNYPFISVIVPVFNGEETIEECIQSLLNLSYPEDRYVIIVDNNSTDNTKKIVEKYPVKLLLETKRGSYAARNTGIRAAKGDILAFTDSDCIVKKDWLIKLLNGFNSEKVGCVAGEIVSCKGSTLVERYSYKNNILSQKNALNNNFFLPYPQTANVAYKKEVFNLIGLFDDILLSGGDADIAWRMQLKTNYNLAFIPKAIVWHRHRTTIRGLLKQHIKYGFGYISLYKKYEKFLNLNLTRELKSYFKIIYYFIKFIERYTENLINHKEDIYIYEPLLDCVCQLGFCLGKIRGLIKLI